MAGLAAHLALRYEVSIGMQGVRSRALAVKQLSLEQWHNCLRQLDRYSYFVTPEFANAWATHVWRDAQPMAWRVDAANQAWRLVVAMSTPSSRLGTQVLTAMPMGAYGTAGQGTMPPRWQDRVMMELRRPHRDSIELTMDPMDEVGPAAAPGPHVVGTVQAWAIDLRQGYVHWQQHQLEKTVRRQLRLATEHGLRTVAAGDADVPLFLSLHARAMKPPQGTTSGHHSEPFVRQLLLHSELGEAKLYLTYLDSQPIAGGLQLRGKQDALAWIGWLDREHAQLHANVHRHAQAIQDLCASGFTSYNLGAAPGLPSVAQFKRKLGAKPIDYEVLRWTNRPLARLRKWVGRA